MHFNLTTLVFATVGSTYAAVPLYRRFCQATGYGGTVEHFETMRQSNDDLLREVESLKQKLEEPEELAKRQGLSGVIHLKRVNHEGGKLAKQS